MCYFFCLVSVARIRPCFINFWFGIVYVALIRPHFHVSVFFQLFVHGTLPAAILISFLPANSLPRYYFASLSGRRSLVSSSPLSSYHCLVILFLLFNYLTISQIHCQARELAGLQLVSLRPNVPDPGRV